MQSHDRIRHAVLVDLLRRSRAHLPAGPISQAMLDDAAEGEQTTRLLLAVDIDTLFERLWQQDLLPSGDRPSWKHGVNSSYKEDQSIL